MKLRKTYGFISSLDLNVADIKTYHFSGLLPKLATCLSGFVENTPRGVVREVRLCGDLDFIPSVSGAPESCSDLGWGCGYRNIQMLCSHVLGLGLTTTNSSSSYSDAIAKLVSSSPTLESVQLGIEKAWQKGFDRQGANQLGQKLHNTTKWIGATEAVALLRCAGIRTRILDFDSATCPQSALMTWICNYFFQGQSSTTRSGSSSEYQKFCSGRPPLYLQHEGHSRTVVGVIREWINGVEKPPVLLLFDPAVSGQAMKRALEAQRGWQRLVKREAGTFWQQKFQIVVVDSPHPPHISCTLQSHHHQHPKRCTVLQGVEYEREKLIVSEKLTDETPV